MQISRANIEKAIRIWEDAMEAEGRKQHAHQVANWSGGSKPVFRSESFHRVSSNMQDAVTRFLYCLDVIKHGTFTNGEMKMYLSGSMPVYHEPATVATFPTSLNGVQTVWGGTIYASLGIELSLPTPFVSTNWGRQAPVSSIKVTGSPNDLPTMMGQFMTGSMVPDVVLLDLINQFVPNEYEDFCNRHNTLVWSLLPKAREMALKRKAKLDKDRAKAGTPDNIAKRENAARDRARESLAKLMGNECKHVLDDWSPEELLSYLKLSIKHRGALSSLMKWAGTTPLGSKVLELEDVTTALEMAKMAQVILS